jgi:hypothetical protein
MMKMRMRMKRKSRAQPRYGCIFNQSKNVLWRGATWAEISALPSRHE